MTMWIDQLLSAVALGPGLALLVGSSVIAAGAASVVLGSMPATMRRILPPPEEPRFRDYLPFERLDDDGHTLICKHGYIARVWALQGIDHAALTKNQRQAINAARQAAFNAFESSGIEFRMFTFRERAGRAERPEDDPSIAKALREISARWEEHLRHHIYRNRHYLAAYAKTSKPGRAVFEPIDNVLRTRLSEYSPTLLGGGTTTPDTAGTDSAIAPFAALLDPVTRHRPRVVPGTSINKLVATAVAWFHGQGVITFTHGTREAHMRVITLRGVGDTIDEYLVQQLLRIRGEITLVHAIVPMPKATARRNLMIEARGAPAMMVGGLHANHMLQQVVQYLSGTHESGESGDLFKYALTVLAYGLDEADVQRVCRDVERVLALQGMTGASNGFAADGAWWSSMPTWPYLDTPWRVTSNQLATFLLPQTAPAGVHTHAWAARPVVEYLTAERSGYGFTFHPDEDPDSAGHCVVIGPTGGGKTTFLSHVIGHVLTIPGTRVRLFDRFRGTEVFTTAVGGSYVSIVPDPDSVDPAALTASLNPFKSDGTREHRDFTRLWMRQLIDRGDRITDAEDTAIARAVSLIYDHFPPEMRSLKYLANTAFTPGSRARGELTRWIDDDQYGAIFNGTRDTVGSFRHRLVAYDVTTAFDDPMMAPPLISYLMHRVRTDEPGKPCLMCIDETEPMLSNDSFKTFLKQGLQEGRKRQHVYVLCFQRPEAIKATQVDQLVRLNCPTFIFLRNPQGLPADYADHHLTPTELNFVLGRTHRELPWAVLVKRYQGPHTAILDVSLEPLGPWRKVYASGIQDIQRYRRLLLEHDADTAIQRYIATDG